MLGGILIFHVSNRFRNLRCRRTQLRLQYITNATVANRAGDDKDHSQSSLEEDQLSENQPLRLTYDRDGSEGGFIIVLDRH